MMGNGGKCVKISLGKFPGESIGSRPMLAAILGLGGLLSKKLIFSLK
jgi:hypothetical protein